MPFVAAIGSGLSAALGTFTILVVYGIGRLAYSHAAGIVAAVFLAVSPLHSLHSHYPYPDVTMTWFLALAILALVTVLHRPSVPRSVLTAAAAGAAAATKLGGIAAAPPVALGLFLGWRRRVGTLWALVAAGLLALAVLLSLLSLTFGGYYEGSLGALIGRLRAELQAVWGLADPLGQVRMLFGTLWASTDSGQLLLAGAGLVAAAWRRTPLDWVLFVLVGCLGLVLLHVPVPDDRFFVPVMVAATLLGGRAVVEALRASRGRPGPVALVVTLLIAAVLPDLHRSFRQGLFLSLPDTRYLAGLWIQAHVPPSMRVAFEGYWPLGVNERPGATYFDARKPLAEQTERFDLLVTSSLEHGRYVERPEHYPQIAVFFRDLPRSAHLVRSFELLPRGFTHSTIRVWWPAAAPVGSTVRPYLPRPFDDSWNGGVSWLDDAPYDRDDRTWWIRGGYHRAVTLVSQRPFETIGIFLRNGTTPSRVRIRTGRLPVGRAVADLSDPLPDPESRQPGISREVPGAGGPLGGLRPGGPAVGGGPGFEYNGLD